MLWICNTPSTPPQGSLSFPSLNQVTLVLSVWSPHSMEWSTLGVPPWPCHPVDWHLHWGHSALQHPSSCSHSSGHSPCKHPSSCFGPKWDPAKGELINLTESSFTLNN